MKGPEIDRVLSFGGSFDSVSRGPNEVCHSRSRVLGFRFLGLGFWVYALGFWDVLGLGFNYLLSEGPLGG